MGEEREEETVTHLNIHKHPRDRPIPLRYSREVLLRGGFEEVALGAVVLGDAADVGNEAILAPVLEELVDHGLGGGGGLETAV